MAQAGMGRGKLGRKVFLTSPIFYKSQVCEKCTGLQIRVCIGKLYVVGTQKNRLNDIYMELQNSKNKTLKHRSR